MKIWAMLTDGARPWESVGGYSPLLLLKAFVCPITQPAVQGSCLAAAAAVPELPAHLPTAPHPANTGCWIRVGSCLGSSIYCFG